MSSVDGDNLLEKENWELRRLVEVLKSEVKARRVLARLDDDGAAPADVKWGAWKLVKKSTMATDLAMERTDGEWPSMSDWMIDLQDYLEEHP